MKKPRVCLMTQISDDGVARLGYLLLPDNSRVSLCQIPEDAYHRPAVRAAFVMMMKALAVAWHDNMFPGQDVNWDTLMVQDNNRSLN